MSRREDARLHVWFPIQLEKSRAIYNAILALEKVGDYDNVIADLTKDLEKEFVDVKEDKCAKKLDGLVYYENGLITVQGEVGGVIASPWTSTETIKEPKKRKKKHAFYYLKEIRRRRYYYSSNDKKGIGYIAYYQMRAFVKNTISYSSKVNTATFVKALEAYSLLSQEERKLTKLEFPWIDFYNQLREITDILREGYYLTDNQCEDISMIYDTFPDDDVKGSYWRSNSNLENSIDNYLNKSCFKKIGFDFLDFYRRTDNMKSKSENCEELIKDFVNLYNSLYAIKDFNFRTTLIKLGFIEEGYIPNISIGEEIVQECVENNDENENAHTGD